MIIINKLEIYNIYAKNLLTMDNDDQNPQHNYHKHYNDSL